MNGCASTTANGGGSSRAASCAASSSRPAYTPTASPASPTGPPLIHQMLILRTFSGIRAAAISDQLSGESAVTAVQTRESLYRTQLIELRTELDRLMLTFTERNLCFFKI